MLLEGFNPFLGTTNMFEWGKVAYKPGENGGITGIIQYSTTRAENDPRFAAAETWETGIPRVQVNLYKSDAAGNILNVNNELGIQLADVDNYPFWSEGTPGPGPEDTDRNGNGVFDAGDAVNVAHTDSWDDNPPTNCPGDARAIPSTMASAPTAVRHPAGRSTASATTACATSARCARPCSTAATRSSTMPRRAGRPTPW